MSWILGEIEKKVKEAKTTIGTSFKEAGKVGIDDVEQPGKPTTELESDAPQKSISSSMSSFFGGLKVSGASTKIMEYAKDASKKLEEVKNTVYENTLLGDLNKEQTEFEKTLKEEKEKTTSGVALPWEGLPDESLAKKQILSLSLDTRNFVRDSPADSEYSYEEQQAMAAVLIQQDPNLAKTRFQLVPKVVKEDNFWKNYFYRVGLIRQTLAKKEEEIAPPVEPKPEPTTSDEKKVEETAKESDEESRKTESPELVTVQPETADPTVTSVDDEWEREILADLNGYEELAEKTGKDDEAWEAEIQNLLTE